MDWNSATTKKHIKEAEAVGLTLIGEGKNANYRAYRFNDCKHEQEIVIAHVRIKSFRCKTCIEENFKDEATTKGLVLISRGKDYRYRIYRFNDCGHEQEIATINVHRHSFQCKKCIETNEEEEAKNVDLTLISRGKNKNYRIYRFNECGHEQELQPSSVRKNSIRCAKCLKKKFENEAKAVNLTIIGSGKSSTHRTYRFNECGHEQEITTGCVRANRFRCKSCLQKKFDDEAKTVGLTLIGAGKNTDYRTYRFKDCGHEHEIRADSVRRNEFRCNQCFQIQLETEAKDVGLTLIGKVRNKDYRTYRFNKCKHEQEITISHVRINSFWCNQCVQIKHEKEAKAVGLTLIGDGRNYSYRTYRLNDCKHEQEIAVVMVRRNSFRCEQCLQIKFEEEAKAVGLTLIGEGRNADYRTYSFNDCGHEEEKTIQSVRLKRAKCIQCFKLKLQNEAKDVGLTLIGKGKNRNYRTYRFNECKHEQEIVISHVRRNEFKCSQCHQLILEKEAKKVGLILIGLGRQHAWRTYRFIECEHEQEIQKSNVRNDNFVCNACEETSWSLPSKVYLLEIKIGSFKWLKLGYAKTIKTRIYRYRLPESVKVKRLKVIDFDTGREAYDFESSLHTKYKRKKLPVKKMKEKSDKEY
ncbi:MAG: hypothetical protein P8L75_01900 [Gammaproteobacteria bacterium]|nr:hypothetical protein [Gammaproteobacteria bacterium]